MFSAARKAILQLADAKIRKVLFKTFLCAAVLYGVMYTLFLKVISGTELFTTGWLESISDFLGGALVFGLSVVFFPTVIIVIVGIFLEEVALAVEEKHYPDLPVPRNQPIMETIISAVKFAFATIIINVFMLPFLLIPLVNIAVFYAVNGYLFSREYFELVGLRRVDAKTVVEWRRKNKVFLWIGGVIIFFLMTVPIVNMLAPVIATAFMVHLFQKISSKQESA